MSQSDHSFYSNQLWYQDENEFAEKNHILAVDSGCGLVFFPSNSEENGKWWGGGSIPNEHFSVRSVPVSDSESVGEGGKLVKGWFSFEAHFERQREIPKGFYIYGETAKQNSERGVLDYVQGLA